MLNQNKLTPKETKLINGARLYMIRRQKNLTQTQLANMLGVTFQQVQKYEKGVNGLTGFRLLQLSNIFNKPMEYFYKPLDQIGYEGNKTSENIII